MNRQDLKKLIREVLTEAQNEPTVDSTAKKISYSAVVLDEKSQKDLKDLVKDFTVKTANNATVPIVVRDSGWEWYCHHMTINMGPLKDNLRANEETTVGSPQKLTVIAIGASDKAVAVKVQGLMAGHSKNAIPHVTVAVNKKQGGKPVDSNKITDWQAAPKNLVLKGKVEEIPQN